MVLLGIFGITNDSLNTAVNVLLLVLVVVYFALIFWTFADARRRIEDPMLVACATAASLFPFVGTIVYLIVRPPEFVDDVRLRELEMTAAEARLAQLDYQLCPHCDYEIKADYLRCPSCARKLKERCYSCGKPVDPSWQLCPYCEAEVHATPPPPTRGGGLGRARLRLAERADAPRRVDRLRARVAALLELAHAARTAQVVRLDLVVAVRAERVLEIGQPRLGGGHLELAQAHVVEELRRAHDQVDDRPDEREEGRERRADDQQRVVDAPASVGERPEDQRQIEHAENEQRDAGVRLQRAVLDVLYPENGERGHV